MDVREKLVELLADAGMGKTERNFLADQLITNGVTAQGWISVKDRLPDTCVCVLVHYDDGNMLVDAIGSDGEWMDEDFIYGNITHWMQLPEPPKGE